MKANNEQAIYQLQILYKNKEEIILEKYKRDLAEKNGRITMKMQKILSGKNNEERHRFQNYLQRQQKLDIREVTFMELWLKG